MPKKNMKDMGMDKDMWMKHKKCIGIKMIVLGALVMANAYWNTVSWATFIGAALALGGIAKLFMSCKCK